jgi:hypothetical protein
MYYKIGSRRLPDCLMHIVSVLSDTFSSKDKTSNDQHLAASDRTGSV